MRSSPLALLVLSVALPLTSSAQVVGSDEEKEAANRSAPSVFDPTAKSSMSLPQPAVVFTASQDEKTATVRIGKSVGSLSLGEFYVGGSISGPLGKNGGSIKLASLDGLASATTVSAQASMFNWHPKPADPLKLKGVCQQYLQKDECTRGQLPSDEARKQWDDLTDYGNPWLASLAFKIGHQNFDYLDASTLEASTQETVPWSLRVGIGLIQPGLGYLGAAWRREHAFKAGASTQICAPFGPAGTLRCDSTTLGAPAASSSNIGEAELRLFWRYAAVNPHIAYDFSKNVFGLELPVYFVQNGDGGFTAGVSLGWRSDDRRAGVTFFVGEALGLLPK